jgi:protease-4
MATHGVGRHTALVELSGVIDAEGESSADNINAALRAAFEDHNTAGVVLRINSPGGSPVQAGIIHDEILRLRGLHPDTRLYVVVEEVCASGGYYVAAAADQILVDKASLVGSIGVLMEGFGFVGAMDKLGVERRLLTAGANKGFLDSFSPLSEDHRQHARRMLGEIHEQFIEVVRKGRGDRLKESPEMFSGLVWTGARSVELGLSDGLGTVDSVARDLIKAEDVVDFSSHKTLAERLAKKVGASAGASAAQVFEGFLSGWRLR